MNHIKLFEDFGNETILLVVDVQRRLHAKMIQISVSVVPSESVIQDPAPPCFDAPAAQAPPAGASINNLTQLAVTFSEPVSGVNAGDLLAHWSGGRWRSAIHRMLPPAAHAVDESLLSLVYFCDPDPDTVVVPFDGDAAPITAGDYLRSKIAAITMQ